MPDCPQGEKVSPYTQSEPLLFHFMPASFSSSCHEEPWSWLSSW